MKKVVFKLDFADEKNKQKAMKKVSALPGLESILLDPKDKKLTVTGDIDPAAVVAKLRKICPTEIVSVGPAKEPEKEEEDLGKEKEKPETEEETEEPETEEEEPEKVDEKKKYPSKEELTKAYYQQFYQQPYYYNTYYYNNHHQNQPAAPSPYYYHRSVEEDPNACVIC